MISNEFCFIHIPLNKERSPAMNGKKLIAIVIVISLIALILTWIYGQKIISDFDIDRAMSSTTLDSNIFLHHRSI